MKTENFVIATVVVGLITILFSAMFFPQCIKYVGTADLMLVSFGLGVWVNSIRYPSKSR